MTDTCVCYGAVTPKGEWYAGRVRTDRQTGRKPGKDK